jgi:NCS1 family nucleobase:cation symporter-1
VLLIGALSTLWALGGEDFWKWVQHASTVLLGLLCLGMSVIVLRSFNPAALWGQGHGSALGLLSGADLVIAMSVSWVPLVADYARYARSPRAASRGTFWGYFVGGTWMYATGLLVALATGKDTPDQMVVEVLGRPGLAWALLGTLLVLLSTVTTTFLDIFSTVVSTQNLLPRVPLRLGSIVAGALGALCALTLDVFEYQGFLLAIGEVFLPAFTIVIVDYFVLRRQAPGRIVQAPAWNAAGLAAWLLGAAVFDWASGWSGLGTLLAPAGVQLAGAPWPSGASLPCLAASAGAYLLLRRLRGPEQ